MSKIKKEPKQMWIRVHIFVKDQVYQVTDHLIDNVQKQLSERRARLPKEFRSSVQNLQYIEVPAPWDTHKDVRQETVSRVREIDETISGINAIIQDRDRQISSLQKAIDEANGTIDNLLKEKAALRAQIKNDKEE
jgi:chromosome segregation ATPase